MEYRQMENLKIKTSLLGFGCMRFPTSSDGSINEAEALDMIDKAYKSGVNYFDTAYPYHGGKSEGVTGKALARYPRDSYYLATKLPIWNIKEPADAKRIFEEQLTRLNKDYVDFYLLHGLNKNSWKIVKDFKLIEFCEELKAAGKIKYLGFSFHDDYETFKEIISYRKWDFCQIQLNYMDKDSQATTKGVELAESLGIPMIIMEPVKGGSLASLPDKITDILREVQPELSTSSWAMRYVASFDNVKVILSGMSNMAQVEDNLKTFTNYEPLSEKEMKTIEEVSKAIKERMQNGCTKCRYCMPCPAGVNIPGSFQIWNEYHMYGNLEDTRWCWEREIPDNAKPKNCVKCGKCEQACPQHLSIRADLEKVQTEMEKLFS